MRGHRTHATAAVVARGAGVSLGALVALVALVAASSGCGWGACTAAGCSSGASLSLSLPGASAGATVTACFNDACATATLPEEPAGGQFGSGLTFGALPGGGFVIGSLWTVSDGVRLDVRWELGSEADLQVGDRYSVTVVDPAGAPVGEVRSTAVSYQVTRPNGADCPPICRRARLATVSP